MTMTNTLVRRLTESKLTQVQIAEGSGVPQTTISRILRGGTPRLDTADKLIAFLDSQAKKRKRGSKGEAASTAN